MSNLRLPFFITFLLLSACVTINVYFPAAAAEKAADQIIDGVWGEKHSKEPIPTSQTKGLTIKPDVDDDLWGESEDHINIKPFLDKESKVPTPAYSFSYTFIHLLDILIQPAYAGLNIDISSPRIKALEIRMSKRH